MNFLKRCLWSQNGKENEFHNLDKEFHKLIFIGCHKINIWESIMKISTHYNRMRLLSERKTDKALLVKQHEEMLSIIKNKDLDKIDEYIEKHIVAPAKEWIKLINDNEEIRRYLK